jgi:ribonuclease HI
MSSYECQTCGRSFSVPEKTLERYPAWTPKKCLKCHGGARTNGGARASGGARSGGGRGAGATPASLARGNGALTQQRDLTLGEVLVTYTAGPTTGVFTDGAAHPNPGQGGWGAVYVIDNEIVDQVYGHESQTTNNRMELAALIAGYGLIPAARAATVMTDSRLCVSTINEWAAPWEKNGWKRKGGALKYLDLVQELYRIAKARPVVELCWIKAHSGYRWNEYADALATAYRRQTL